MHAFLYVGGRGVVHRCECICARDVGVLLLPAPAYICLAVCRLGSIGGEFGRMGVCRRNGWKCVGRGVGAGGGASRREPRGGVVPLQSPRPPCRRLLLIGFSTAGLRLLSPAGPSAGERTRELSGWFGPGRLPPHCPRVPTRHRTDPLRQPPSQPRAPNTSMDCCTVS